MEVFVPNNFAPANPMRIPASKSIAQRAILAAALSAQNSKIHFPGKSDDVLHLIGIARSLGCVVLEAENQLEIQPNAQARKTRFDAGESGLAARLLLPVLAAIGGRFELVGKGSLLSRPMTQIIELLRQAGIDIQSVNEHLPIQLEGKLKGGAFKIDGSWSSQHVSGLLMALPLCAEDSVLRVTDLLSKPYVDLTLEVMTNFGIRITKIGYDEFRIQGGQSYRLNGSSYEVEGDYSAAANWIVAGAIAQKPVSLLGLKKESLQGDRVLLELAGRVGARLGWVKDQLEVCRVQNQPFVFDATDCPDLFPPLVVLAAAAKGQSEIIGIQRLVHKESNRALTLQQEFSALGLDITLHENSMLVKGTGGLKSGVFHAHNDHRLAMAGALAALLTPAGLRIVGAEAVSKSYPEFWIHCGINR